MFAEIFGMPNRILWIVGIIGFVAVGSFIMWLKDSDSSTYSDGSPCGYPKSWQRDSSDTTDDDFDQGYNQDRSQNG